MQDPQKPRLIKPGEEDDDKFERDIAHALTEIEPKKEDEPASHRDLVPRSKASFTSHIEQLQARIDDVDKSIFRSMRGMHDEIIAAKKKHAAFLHEAEKDLAEIKTLKGAIELALAALGMERK